MRSFLVKSDGCGLKDSAELNHHLRDEHKEDREGAVGEGQDLSEEDEARINEVAQNFTDRKKGPLPVRVALQGQQQQLQGPVVRWERFLPFRSLKVLLVENDDSTRHILSALLRNCSYEVTAASNGLQAWKILEDLSNHIDLVLTEVVMPCLSGIGLLCKIMNHETCKNIPVIMMSSHDSMGVVFKCLSKGAVDFLVKPIRKNELKNLWHHVWRRCHSSSGSGSESCIQTQKYAKSKSADDSDNNTESNDEDDNGSLGFNNGDGSDNGSGTKTSWTKRAVEVDSPEPVSLYDQLTDPPDNTCSQVVYSKPATFCNDWVPTTSTWECKKQMEQPLDNAAMGIDLEIGVAAKQDLLLESYLSEKISTNQVSRKRDDRKVNKGQVELHTSNPTVELTVQAADLIGVIAQSQMEMGIVSETPNSISKTSEIKDKTISEAKDLPFLELSLKRPRSTGDSGTAANDERNVLRHSDMSAFSRYNTAAAPTQTPTGYGGSCPPVDGRSEAVKTNLPSKSNDVPLNQGSNGSSNNNDMGSTTTNIVFNPGSIKSVSTLVAKCLNHSAFQRVQLYQTCPQQIVSKKADDVVTSVGASVGQPRGAQSPNLVQHHHHSQNLQQKQKQPFLPDHDEKVMKNMEAEVPQTISSNVFGGTADGNTGNYSLNASVSGSNHGSNGQNGSSTGVNISGMNMESDNGMVGKSGAGGGNRSGVNQSQFAQREAALKKFQQKRKERCFQKKVRYQSRKSLAEQRPRMCGQFVRQTVYEHTSHEGDQ